MQENVGARERNSSSTVGWSNKIDDYRVYLQQVSVTSQIILQPAVD